MVPLDALVVSKADTPEEYLSGSQLDALFPLCRNFVLGLVSLTAVIGSVTDGAAAITLGPTTTSTDVISTWSREARTAVTVANSGAARASRELAIVNLSVYDAVNSIYQDYQPFFVDTVAAAKTSPEAAAATAAYTALSGLFPQQKSRFDQVLAGQLEAIPNGRGKDQGVTLGQSVASSLLAWRADDPEDLSLNTPFGLTSPSQFRSPPPPATASAEFAASYNQIKEKGRLTNSTRTPEETQIGLFWANQTNTHSSSGQAFRIAEIVAEQQGLSLLEKARLFGLLGIAVGDSGIAATDSKNAYETLRPKDLIRNGDNDDNPSTVGDPTWEPLVASSGFDYPSLLSTSSGATAAVLEAFFGTDELALTLDSPALPGVTRSFASFSDAATEASQSRVFSGYHFSFSNAEGRFGLGDRIGDYTAATYLRPVAVPEPGSMAGLTTAGVLLMLWRWQQRKNLLQK